MPTALVLGASRGIGLELARQYRAEGWRVFASARDDAGVARVEALGAQGFTLDVAKAESVSGVEWKLEGEKFDHAYYVAGVIDSGDARTPPNHEQFDRMMHTNVLGAMQLIPSVAPMVSAARGKFVFLSSLLGSIASTDSSREWLYRVSKAALNMAVHAAQPDYPNAIFVAMSPGWVKTDMGGPSAAVELDASVKGIRAVVAGLDDSARGRFYNYQGRELPW